MAAKTEFLARMSHQLRTPVFGIVGSLDQLQGEGMNRPQDNAVKVIRNCCDTLLSTVSDILDFSKLEYRSHHLNEALIDVQELISSCLEMYQSQIAAKNIKLVKLYVHPFPRYIIADPTRLKQVLLNLLSNSVKFTPENGKITLKVSTNYSASKVKRNTSSVRDEILSEPSTPANPVDSLKRSGLCANESLKNVSKNTLKERTNPLSERETPSSQTSKVCESISYESMPIHHDSVHEDPMVTEGSVLRCSDGSIIRESGNNIVIGTLYFTITDTGIGIKKSIQSQIMEPFYRTDAFPDAINEGNGLGLTLAKHFVEDMSGDLHFHSRGYNKGSTFAFNIPYKVPRKMEPPKTTLPHRLLRSSTESNIIPRSSEKLTHPDDSHVSATCDNICFVKSSSNDRFVRPSNLFASVLRSDREDADEPPDPANKKRILIVEDNAVNRKIIRRMIVKLGFSVDVAENGQVAIEYCTKSLQRGIEYVVILMDIEMPCMGGLEATEKLRTQYNIKTPIIALSAHALVEIRDKALEVGVNGFITKPFSYNVLVEEISKHVET